MPQSNVGLWPGLNTHQGGICQLKKPKTNITPELKAQFNAMVSGKYDNFALFSCFVNGKPAASICAVTQEEESKEYLIVPLFVSITPEMVLTDHDWRQA